MRSGKINIRDVKKKVRARFEAFIAAQLDSETDVGTDALALAFSVREADLLKKIAHASITNILVKWADDILNQSIGKEAARNSHPQLTLPISLQGITLPGAFSFINGANKLRFVANYKAQRFHLESHSFVLRKHEDEVRESRKEFEKLLDAVTPLMENDPAMTLKVALEALAESEAGAA